MFDLIKWYKEACGDNVDLLTHDIEIAKVKTLWLNRNTQLQVLYALNTMYEIAHKRHDNWLRLVQELWSVDQGNSKILDAKLNIPVATSRVDVMHILLLWATNSNIEPIVDRALSLLTRTVSSALCNGIIITLRQIRHDSGADWPAKWPPETTLTESDMILTDHVVPHIISHAKLLRSCLVHNLLKSYVQSRREHMLTFVRQLFMYVK